MLIPQYLVLALILNNLIADWIYDGDVKENPKHSFRKRFLDTTIWVILLIWGGFFKNLFTITF